jgi:membrane protease YdiL (CAAX protease family)
MASAADNASWIYRIAWIFYLVLALAATLWLGLRQGQIRLGLFIDTDSWWLDAGLGLSAGGLLIALWLAARRVWPAARDLERELADILGPMTTSEVVGLAVLSGFAEELFFRGAVQGAWGWIPATVLFTLLHTGPGVSYRAWTGFAAVAGLVLAGLMIWRGNLLAPVIAHMVVNGINLDRLSRLPTPREAPPAMPK